MASRVKRADTSAIRPEPLVMTTKFTITRMAKTMTPMTRLPPMTNWPKASMIWRSEEHTSELQSLMRNSYAVFCLKKNKLKMITNTYTTRKSTTQTTTHPTLYINEQSTICN